MYPTSMLITCKNLPLYLETNYHAKSCNGQNVVIGPNVKPRNTQMTDKSFKSMCKRDKVDVNETSP